MSSQKENDSDIFKFLSNGPKIIDDFRQSAFFYVKEYNRGIYPRNLLKMLQDMDMVKSFKPYKSSNDEITKVSNELDKLGISKDRKEVLLKYVFWQLTDNGKDILKSTNEIIDTKDIDTKDIDTKNIDTKNIDTKNIDTKNIDTIDTKNIETNNNVLDNIESKENKVKKTIIKKTEKVINTSQNKDKNAQVSKFNPIENTKLDSLSSTSINKKESNKDLIFNKQENIKNLEEELSDLGFRDRSRKKEINKEIKKLKDEIQALH